MTQKITPFALEKLTTEVAKEGVPFLLKLSHELKTPIHGISGISAYLSDNWKELDDITRRKSVAAISSASENLVKLVDSLLDNTSGQKQINFEFVELDLVKATESVIETCKNLYINKKDIQIKLENQVDQCLSKADPFWYGQLLTNLLSNSINYSTQGSITVKFSTAEMRGVHNCIVSVQDEGVGIPDEELDSIFSPFNRGAAVSLYPEGIGLGLTICREIVEAHGGIISASNNQEIGSTVEFSFPTKM